MPKSAKRQYRIRNWNEYDAALKQRGSLTFWMSEDVVSNWLTKEKTGRRGASNTYSDVAIATTGTIQLLFGLASRQTEGFLQSLFELIGMELPVPDHTTISRRRGKLEVEMPVQKTDLARHIVVDSTGVKIYGEGEWKVRQHGWSKRRTWRKLHIGVDEATGEMVAVVASTNDVSDAEVLPDLLNDIDGEIEQVSADGAYDQGKCYEAIAQRQAAVAIPPRKSARIQQHGNCKAPTLPRDENLRSIRQIGRQAWKRESGYHRRSLAETTMFRLKTIFSGKLRTRKFDNQAVELFLQCAALNRMIQVCKPDSYVVES